MKSPTKLLRPASVPQWLRWLVVGFLAVLATNLLVGFAFGALTGQPHEARRALLPGQLTDLLRVHGTDSWGPMLTAMEAHVRDPDGSLYALPQTRGLKFQYPPSSLFFTMLVPGARELAERCATEGEDCVENALEEGQPMLITLATLLYLAGLGLALSSAALSLRQLAPRDPPSALQRATAYGLGILLAASYYPATKGVTLGQIQVLLGLLLSLSMLAYASGYTALSGVLAGVCVLAKPQYVMLLVWGALRRDVRFAAGFLVVAALGTLGAVYAFGLHNHVEYFNLLRAIGRVGEAFWPNQSVNGILNRWLGTDTITVFNWRGFPRYSTLVYVGTLVSSALILLAVFWPNRLPPAAGSRRTADLAVAIMGSTMASPIAWEHHYGVFFACFGALAPLALRVRPLAGFTGPFVLLIYLAVAVELTVPGFFYRDGAQLRGLLGAHLFFGAIAWLALGMRLRRGDEAG